MRTSPKERGVRNAWFIHTIGYAYGLYLYLGYMIEGSYKDALLSVLLMTWCYYNFRRIWNDDSIQWGDTDEKPGSTPEELDNMLKEHQW